MLAGNNLMTKECRAAYKGESGPVLKKDELAAPSKLKKTAVIGVQFMGDLFHENVSDYDLLQIWSAMCLCGSYPDTANYTFFILTKRPKRMAEWVFHFFGDEDDNPRPVPSHIWIGTSIEDQPTADERIPILLDIPAAKRFVSIEPMLGEIEMTGRNDSADYYLPFENEQGTITPGIDWIILGPGKRPMNLDWARSIRDQCKLAGVPFFYKPGELDGIECREFPE